MGVESRFSKVAIAKATSGSWGTGVAVATAVGAGDGYYVRGDLGVQLQMQRHPNDSAAQDFIGSVEVSNVEAVQVQIPMFLHYNDTFQNILWALALGTGGTAPVQVGATTAYTNTFEPATSKTGNYATVVRDKVQYISEVPGVKFTGFEITTGENGRMEITWSGVGSDEKRDSSINTSTQISALTFHNLGNRAFKGQGVFRVNSQSGGALAGGDALKWTALRVRFAQPVDSIHVGGQTSLIEPHFTGFPDLSIEITCPRFDATNDTFFTGHRANSRYKADLTFTGAAIDATSNYGLLMQFPNLEVMKFQAPVPSGQVTPVVSFNALSTTTAPTGMTGITRPMRVTTTGTQSTNPFA